MRRVVITGVGAVTPIGNTAKEMWAGVREGKCGIDKITKYDISNRKVKVAAEVKNLPVEELVDKHDLRKMDLFCALDGLDSISLSGTNADGWYIDEAKKALEDGSISFAGKYSAPDYELILSKNCDLAIESTMIYHKPEVKEKLEQFGIPVLVEHSSYESHPLGRTEWLKLYGVLLGKEELADKLFQEQVDKLKAIEDSESTDGDFYSVGTLGLFYDTQHYTCGKYIFSDLGAEEDNSLSTMNMQMEEFYAGAKDADYIIYNSTIDGELTDISQMLEKSSLLADFKAVKDGNVWCTNQNLFQETMELGTMIEDIHTMLTSDDPNLDTLTYMHKLK